MSDTNLKIEKVYECNTINDCRTIANSERAKRKKWMYSSFVIGIIGISVIAGIAFWPKPVVPTYVNTFEIAEDFYITTYDGNDTIEYMGRNYNLVAVYCSFTVRLAMDAALEFFANMTVGEFKEYAETKGIIGQLSTFNAISETMLNITGVNQSIVMQLRGDDVLITYNNNGTLFNWGMPYWIPLNGKKYDFNVTLPAMVDQFGGIFAVQYKNNGTLRELHVDTSFSPLVQALYQPSTTKMIDQLPILRSGQNNTIRLNGMEYNATASSTHTRALNLTVNGKPYMHYMDNHFLYDA